MRSQLVKVLRFIDLPLIKGKGDVEQSVNASAYVIATCFCLLFLTGARQLVVWLLPIVSVTIWWSGSRIVGQRFWLTVVALTVPIISGWLYDGAHLIHNLLSLWVIAGLLAVIYLPSYSSVSSIPGSSVVFRLFVLAIIICDLIGVWQYAIGYEGRWQQQDDNFIGFYGRTGNAMHGLAILNYALCLAFGNGFADSGKRLNLLLSLFFLLAATLCFYGLGSMFWMAGLAILLLLRINQIRVWVLVLLLVAVKFLVSFTLAPKTMGYAMTSYQKVANAVLGEPCIPDEVQADTAGANSLAKTIPIILAKRNNAVSQYNLSADTALINKAIDIRSPRKLQAFQAWIGFCQAHPKTMVFGLGPGTVNSRTSFFLTGTYSTSKAVNDLASAKQPGFAAAYIHPLWSPEVLAIKYSDGTRNQPFSSILALFAEYGLFAGLVLLTFTILYWINLFRQLWQVNRSAVVLVASIWVMLLGHLLTDNFAESSEFVLLVLLLHFIFSQAQHQSKAQTTIHAHSDHS